MIRYDINEAELARRAEKVKPGWSARANVRTQQFAQLGFYQEIGPIWSEIKDVFRELQKRKCAFCERKLESKKEYDVEHFRPKGSVKPWPVPPELTNAGVVVKQPANGVKEDGYHLLAYNLLNYSVACAKCNSELKSDYFPIFWNRESNGTDPVQLNKDECPLLVFPIGKIDDNPEDIITFHGFSPIAKPPADKFGHQRALLTIKFFKLDDRNQRRELFRGRADVIQKIGQSFMLLGMPAISAQTKTRCENLIAYHTSDESQYSSCGRAFVKLWKSDPQKAENLWNESVDWLTTVSPPRR